MCLKQASRVDEGHKSQPSFDGSIDISTTSLETATTITIPFHDFISPSLNCTNTVPPVTAQPSRYNSQDGRWRPRHDQVTYCYVGRMCARDAVVAAGVNHVYAFLTAHYERGSAGEAEDVVVRYEARG